MPKPAKSSKPAQPVQMELYGLGTVNRIVSDIHYLETTLDKNTEMSGVLADEINALVLAVGTLSENIWAAVEELIELRDQLKKDGK